MVYSGFSTPSRANWKAWFITSFRYLESAEREISHNYEVADYNAKHAVELALKGLIESKEGSLPRRYTSGREGHSILDIWNYVKERGWINPDEIPRVIIADIAYTDMAGDSGTRVIDCVTGMIAHEKYPHNGMAPHELMNPHEVTEMVKNCRVVIEKLSEKAG